MKKCKSYNDGNGRPVNFFFIEIVDWRK